MVYEACRTAADWIPAQPLYDHAPPGFIAQQRIEGHALCIGDSSCACQHRPRAEKISEGEHVDG